MVEHEIFIERLAATDLMKEERSRIRTRIDALFHVDAGRGEKN
ncbi:MAG: hypothetical protein ACE5OQ_01970 [Woeseia sp.]